MRHGIQMLYAIILCAWAVQIVQSSTPDPLPVPLAQHRSDPLPKKVQAQAGEPRLSDIAVGPTLVGR